MFRHALRHLMIPAALLVSAHAASAAAGFLSDDAGGDHAIHVKRRRRFIDGGEPRGDDDCRGDGNRYERQQAPFVPAQHPNVVRQRNDWLFRFLPFGRSLINCIALNPLPGRRISGG